MFDQISDLSDQTFEAMSNTSDQRSKKLTEY